MIVQCPDCTTRYQLDPERVPPERIRVRCPNCRYVFPIDGTLATHPVPEPAAMAEPSPEPAHEVAAAAPDPDAIDPGAYDAPTDEPDEKPIDEPAREPAAEAAPPVSPDPSALDLEIERPSAAAAPAPSAPAASPGSPSPEPAVAVAEKPRADESDEDPQRRKARRLARALVSDILVYNRETRDKSLAEGTLVQALGTEIKKSWELYKERVTPEVANSNNDFREALNEILADGQKIF